MKGELCRCCRGLISADPADPAPGVLRHIRTPEHDAWRIGLVAEVIPTFLPAADGLPVMRFSPAERMGRDLGGIPA